MHDDSIIAAGVTVVKNKKTILKNVSFTITPGKITGLIGPSGSGKTTLMRALVGVQQVSRGHIQIMGLPAGHKNLRSKIGYVTQNAAVYDDLTVAQNLRYFAALTSASRGQIEETIEKVQLGDQRNQLVNSLSGGQRARVSLAAALLGDSELLVMDEPTVGLDPVLREELWGLFAELAKSGKTLLVSSHVMDEAERCRDLLLLRDGQLLWNDSKDKLLAHTGTSSVQAAFLGMIKEKKQ